MVTSTDAFSERLRQAVAMSGMSQTEIARELHVTRQAIAGWIKEGTMHRQRIVPFCDACRVDIRWLLTGEGDAALQLLPRDRGSVEGLADDIAGRLSVSDQLAIVAVLTERIHKLLG